MADAAILDFENCKILLADTVLVLRHITVPNFVIGLSVKEIIVIFQFLGDGRHRHLQF